MKKFTLKMVHSIYIQKYLDRALRAFKVVLRELLPDVIGFIGNKINKISKK